MIRDNRKAADVSQPRVLLAEDDEEMRKLLARALRADGYAVVECRDGVDLFEHLNAFVVRTATLDIDAIVSDVVNPILLLLLINQAATGLLADALPRRAFEILHEGGGLALVLVGALHLVLNWSWVRSTYLRRS